MKLDCFSKEHCDLVRCKVGQRKARMHGAGRRRTRRAPMRVSVTHRGVSTAGEEGRPYLQATMVAIMLRIQAKQTTKSAFSLGKAPKLEQQLPSLLPGRQSVFNSASIAAQKIQSLLVPSELR